MNGVLFYIAVRYRHLSGGETIHRLRLYAYKKVDSKQEEAYCLCQVFRGHRKILACVVLKKISSLAYFCGFGNYFRGTI